MNNPVTVLPPKNITAIAPEERGAILAAIRDPDNQTGRLWSEKLRRFASLYGRRLNSVAAKRFGSTSPDMLAWIGEALIASAKFSEFKGTAPFDPAFLNAASFCSDALPSGERRMTLEKALSQAVESYRSWLMRDAPQAAMYEALGPEFKFVPGRWKEESRFASGVVILAPTSFSLFTICVLEICIRLNIPVAAIVIRNFTLSRLRQEWSRDGVIVLKKVWRKIILRSDENSDEADTSLAAVHQSLNVEYADVRKRAASLGIPVIYVDHFEAAPPDLTRLAPRVAVFTGGGLISAEFLRAFSDGVINIHHGHLPHYRGMDVVHAPLLEGRFDTVGLTAHFMSARLDEGPVLTRGSVDPRGYRGINSLRNAVSAFMPLLAIDAMLGYFSKRLVPIEQSSGGRQYFLGHERLNEVLEERLSLHQQTGDARLRDIVNQFMREFGT